MHGRVDRVLRNLKQTSKLTGKVKCKVCNQGYKQQYITEDGICDWCDQERLDEIDSKRGEQQWHSTNQR